MIHVLFSCLFTENVVTLLIEAATSGVTVLLPELPSGVTRVMADVALPKIFRQIMVTI